CYRDWSSDVCSSDLLALSPVCLAPSNRSSRTHSRFAQLRLSYRQTPATWGIPEEAAANSRRSRRPMSRRQTAISIPQHLTDEARSEERRVGKEGKDR